MTDPAREAFLFVKIEHEIKMAAELNRRGQVMEAVEFVALLEQHAAELKVILAGRTA